VTGEKESKVKNRLRSKKEKRRRLTEELKEKTTRLFASIEARNLNTLGVFIDQGRRQARGGGAKMMGFQQREGDHQGYAN